MVVMGGGRDAQCVCKVPRVVLPCYQAVGPGRSNREKFELELAINLLWQQLRRKHVHFVCMHIT